MGKSLLPPKLWPKDKPIPEGYVLTKKGTIVTVEKSLSLQRARDNAEGKTGRPKARHTVLAEKMREALIEQAHKEVIPMVQAQIQNAKGLTVMMARKWETVSGGRGQPSIKKRSGEFAQVKDPKEMLELLNGNGEGDYFYQIVAKNPSVEAFKVLLEQSIGRPKDPSKRDSDETVPLAVIINNMQKDNKSTSTVTVVPRQIKSTEE